MYIGGDDSSLQAVSRIDTRPSIIKLWQQARRALEACGAEVIETDDFPLVTTYESKAMNGQLVTVADLPDGWPATERCELVAHAWDDFLATNAQKGLESLAHVDPATIFPPAPGSLAGTPDAANALKWDEMVRYPSRKPPSIHEIPGIRQAIQALENARKVTLEQWMDRLGLDAVVFPANGDVGAANADVDETASRFAWSNGVKYSNGNRPIRHLGVPTISVPMGVMEDTGMPVNLTFAGKAYDDNSLLRYGFAFEAATKNRVMPPLVPGLDSDCFEIGGNRRVLPAQNPPELVVESQVKNFHGSEVAVQVQGSLKLGGAQLKRLSCFVNGKPVQVAVEGDRWFLVTSYPVSERDASWERWASPALKQTIVTIMAHTDAGLATGKLILL
jgi:hypothetical protein